MNNLMRIPGSVFALGCLIFALALPACMAEKNGDVVTVTVSCGYSLGLGDANSESALTNLALASPLRNRHGAPVFICQGWERSNGLADGMIVRAYVIKNGQTQLADGVQLSDGRIMVDGEILDRAAP